MDIGGVIRHVEHQLQAAALNSGEPDSEGAKNSLISSGAERDDVAKALSIIEQGVTLDADISDHCSTAGIPPSQDVK